MKRRLNVRFLMIAGVSILVTLILTAAVSYEMQKTEVFQGLKNYAMLAEYIDMDDMEEFDSQKDSLVRISLIDSDGTVLYDSDADASSMENHLERPEVKSAVENGEGYSVRRSETLSSSHFYYAYLLADGRILRVSEVAASFYRVLLRTLPMLMVIAAAIFAACVFVSHFLVESFVSPIKKMADRLEDADQNDAYPEIRPFIIRIKAQHEDLQKSADVRQEFTANVTHELKTPLTSISGYSELIANGMASGDDVTRFAAEIHRNANRLLSLINDIIRLSELDVLNQAPNLEDVDLYEVACGCVNMLKINAKKHDVEIRVHGSSVRANLNRDMMEELIYNLCDNAIRYNKPAGTVDVYVKLQEDFPVLQICDTGIGIPAEHQERIFERFYRVDKSRSKSSGGTGLGLAIVKHIVSVHNARLTVESQPGQGTQITVIFDGKKTAENKMGF